VLLAQQETLAREAFHQHAVSAVEQKKSAWRAYTTLDQLPGDLLVQQMPVLSRFGATPQTNDRPHVLYQRAARRVLDALENSAKKFGNKSGKGIKPGKGGKK